MTDNTVQCPFCDTQSKFGVRVCTGCQATIVYGATQTELTNTLKQTGFGVFAIAMLALFMGPTLLNGQFGWSIAPMFGTGLWSLGIAGALGVWLGFRASNSLETSMRGQVRYFRQMANV